MGSISFGKLDDANWFVARVRNTVKGEEFDNYSYFGNPRYAAQEIAVRLADDTQVRGDLWGWIGRWDKKVTELSKALAKLTESK